MLYNFVSGIFVVLAARPDLVEWVGRSGAAVDIFQRMTRLKKERW